MIGDQYLDHSFDLLPWQQKSDRGCCQRISSHRERRRIWHLLLQTAKAWPIE